jgi:hypothetical protein
LDLGEFPFGFGQHYGRASLQSIPIKGLSPNFAKQDGKRIKVNAYRSMPVGTRYR